jgi:ATP-binding cassette subfamily B protein
MRSSPPPHLVRTQILRLVARALWTFRKRVAAALVLLVIAKLLTVAVPFALKTIIDRLSPHGIALELPVLLLLGYAVLRFSGGLVTEVRDLVFARVAVATVAHFNARLAEHLHRLGAHFHSGRQTGSLSRDVERGTNGMAFLLGTALFTLLPTLVEIVTVVGILALGYNAAYSLIVAAAFVVYAVVTSIFTRRRTRLQRRLNELDSRAGAQLVDGLLNHDTIKYFSNEALENTRLRKTLDGWMEVGVENQRALSTLHIAQSAVIALGVSATMLLAGQEVVAGRMSVGDFVLINAYIIQICLPLNTLGMVFRQTREAMINAEQACELLVIPAETADEICEPLRSADGEIRFDGVDFCYEPGRQILWNVAFSVPAGATVAVVGGSGSGKSTLARLLFRFYDPNGGAITLGGQDIRELDRASLRRALGIVPQETILFNDTIAYNIGYGRPGASMAEIIEAATSASVHDFISSLPAQYETVVGERGVKLSGGERQRIAIARALLKNPSILIFDEATSALDTRTERAIQAQLDRIAQGRTTLVIAHRLSTIINADEIIVLERGRIGERGTHAELLSKQGIYAQMWKLQRQEAALQTSEYRYMLQPVHLGTVVANLLDVIRGPLEEKSLRLYTEIGQENTRVTGDPALLHNVLWELMTNAVAVTPPGGRIEIRIESHGPNVRIAITDGRLPPAEAAMQPYEERQHPLLPDQTAIDSAAIASQLRRTGGFFGMDSRPDRHGATYWLDLPRQAPRPVAAIAMGQDDSVGLGDIRVALVVHDHDAHERLSLQLAELGADVQAFASGEGALHWFESHDSRDWPAVLVCEISLDNIDGYTFIAKVRALEGRRGIDLSRRIPAIAMSAHPPVEGRLRALLAGFQSHLAWPVNEMELVHQVHALAATATRLVPGGSVEN